MKAVKESKRLVALLAVLFLMSGVFSVIAAASPEDTEAQSDNTSAGIQITESAGIQSPKVKQVLYEKTRPEKINIQIVPAEISETAAEPAEERAADPEPVSTEAVLKEVETVPAAEEDMVPAEEPVQINDAEPAEEYTEAPEYAEEPVYPDEIIYEEPAETDSWYESVSEEPGTPQEYIPEEYVEVSEPVIEPEPEAQPVAEPVPEAVPAPAPETTPEPSPEPAPAAESNPSEEPKLTYLGNFMLTAYCPCEYCCGAYASGRTASGTVATEGVTIAMGGLEFGTKVSINGHIYTVEDRGTSYGHVDIFFGDHGSALAFGLQYADVYLVE